MIEVCDSLGKGSRPEFNGEEDHLHPLAHHLPKAALSTPVNSRKGVSARLLRHPAPTRKYPRDAHFCSRSSFDTSRGGAPPSIVNEYISNQKPPG
ncbi:transposase [Nonomuraea cavernae]|uniref:Transposase IS200-like domain-containing protein n=1 Tax=Nonomuraea cavernae TaxID=2045107 RepID=A0A918DM98_9ACTN|nr:transposase [Nonomuraea cavernae]MCA2187119.1 transposase [Nonomuraea cavernae]GGO74694.1 hypothetical protein GCM10012289_47970 [Nonomuraea cavernae]